MELSRGRLAATGPFGGRPRQPKAIASLAAIFRSGGRVTASLSRGPRSASCAPARLGSPQYGLHVWYSLSCTQCTHTTLHYYCIELHVPPTTPRRRGQSALACAPPPAPALTCRASASSWCSYGESGSARPQRPPYSAGMSSGSITALSAVKTWGWGGGRGRGRGQAAHGQGRRPVPVRPEAHGAGGLQARRRGR